MMDHFIWDLSIADWGICRRTWNQSLLVTEGRFPLEVLCWVLLCLKFSRSLWSSVWSTEQSFSPPWNRPSRDHHWHYFQAGASLTTLHRIPVHLWGHVCESYSGVLYGEGLISWKIYVSVFLDSPPVFPRRVRTILYSHQYLIWLLPIGGNVMISHSNFNLHLFAY